MTALIENFMLTSYYHSELIFSIPKRQPEPSTDLSYAYSNCRFVQLLPHNMRVCRVRVHAVVAT